MDINSSFYSKWTVKMDPLITHRLPLSKGVEALEMTAERKVSFGKIMLHPEDK